MKSNGTESVPNFCRLLTPPLKRTCHLAAPPAPRLVKIWMTPAAASVPYSVAAAAPFTISIRSISSGLMSLSGLELEFAPRCVVPVKMPLRGYSSLRVRTPSMKMSGWLVSDTEVVPRRRMADPLPALPTPPPTVTPAKRPESKLDTLVGTSGTSAIFTWPMELPTSRFRADPPVPVMTTSSSDSALTVSAKVTVVVAPAVTTTGLSVG